MHKASCVPAKSSAASRWFALSVMAGLCFIVLYWFKSAASLREENRQLRESLAALEQAQSGGAELQEATRELKQVHQFDSYKIQQLEAELSKLRAYSNEAYTIRVNSSHLKTMMSRLEKEHWGLKLMNQRLEDELSGKPRAPRLGGWLGLNVMPATKDNNYPKSENGVVVVGMVENSPAERSMLRMRDVILSVDGEPVSDSTTLKTVMARKDVGKEVVMDVLRTDGMVKVSVTPSGWPQ